MQRTSSTPLTFQNFLVAISGVLLIWLGTIFLHLTTAVFAFLITFTAARKLSMTMRRPVPSKLCRDLIALIIVLCAGAIFVAFMVHFSMNASRTHSDFSSLLQQIVDVLTRFKISLPDSIAQYIPGNVDQIRGDIANWLKTHAHDIQMWGKNALHAFGYIIAGIVIAAVVLFQVDERPEASDPALTSVIFREFNHLTSAFANVVFAQAEIAAINTVLTAIYLLGILPLIGHPLPMSSTLLVFTFFAGLIPVVGNLASNAAIVLLSLGDSTVIVVTSIIWLLLIHKLEYVLNANIIGHRIHARAWELLSAMLLCEACFGMTGVICAPIIYAQIKRICLKNGWLGVDSTGRGRV